MQESSEPTFNPLLYWERRLREHPDIVGVGYIGRSPEFVALQYRQRMHQVVVALRDAPTIDLTNSSVLDVGSGIGIWLTFWHQQHAQRIVGLDFTRASVEQLRRAFPADRIVQADISEQPFAALNGAAFDIVSVFDVLLHIVDALAFHRAIANLAQVCKPGGWLFMTDPLISGHGYVAAQHAGAHVKIRTLDEYCQLLAEHGFIVERVLPAAYLLNQPLEGHTQLVYRILLAWWKASFVWERSPMLVRLTGPIVLWLDRLLCRFARHGDAPTEKLVVARKRA